MSGPTADPGFPGADPAELGRLAAAMGSHADTLLRHRSVLGVLLHEVPWIGQVADAFRREWTTTYLRVFSDATALLHATRDLLLRKAAAQREASAPTSGGIAIGTTGGRGVPLQGNDGAELPGSAGSILQGSVAPVSGQVSRRLPVFPRRIQRPHRLLLLLVPTRRAASVSTRCSSGTRTVRGTNCRTAISTSPISSRSFRLPDSRKR